MSLNTNSVWRVRSSASLLPILALLAPLGCAASNSSGESFDDAGMSMTSKDAAAGGKDSGTKVEMDSSTSSMGDDAGDASDDGSSGPTISLPFYVSDQFIPSGFMNDPMGIKLSAGANGMPACPDRATTTPGGNCYVVTWASTGPLWAGVYWQYPQNNWGTDPGLNVAAGATQVTFYAKGDVGGEAVQFKVGGINDPMSAMNGNYGDSFAVSSTTEILTTTWTQYTVSLTGASYASGVLGGFCWVAAATDGGNANIKFYVDDIQWQ